MKRAMLALMAAVALTVCSCGYSRFLHVPYQSTIHPVITHLLPEYDASVYYAGAATAIITPPHDTWLAGFFPWRTARGAHDNLEVRTLALIDPAGTKFVFITVDLIGFQYGDVVRVRERVRVVVPDAEVYIMSSHTHAGPDVVGFWGALPLASGRDEHYINEVIDRMVETSVMALEHVQPVEILSGSIDVPDLSKNRREPFLDTELSILAFRSLRRDVLIATVVNFGCHPEVLKNDNHLISSDFVGSMRDYLDYAMHTTTLFVNGALGGMVQPNMKWNAKETFERRDEFGWRLGAYAYWALLASADHVLEVAPITHTRRELLIPLENKKFFVLALLGFMPQRGIVSSGGMVRTEVNMLHIGDVSVVMVPGEIVPELALDIKKMNGPRTQVWALANDEIGYILKKEKFYTPTFKYERTMSLGPEAGPMIMDAIRNFSIDK